MNIIELLNKKMEFEQPPQDLCLKCGKCCKMIVPEHSADVLLEMARNNDDGAKVFLNLFKPYDNIEQAKKVDEAHVVDVVEKLKKTQNISEDEIVFFYCPYVSDENLCKIYHRRPICCKRAPVNGWAFFPEGCGFAGWQFQEREKHKAYVRQLKEALREIEILKEDQINQICGLSSQELKEKIEEKINVYRKYGADNW